MADLRELVEEFATRFEAGDDPDPADWLKRADEAERQELAALIDSYLMTAPRRAWDPAAYESSLAKQAVDRVFESLEGVSGTWPELLPALRNRARVKRSELVRRLAEALGVGTGEPQVEKVGLYYHRMEHGLLPAEGVSQRVIDALAGLVGASAEAIRAAGQSGGERDLGEGVAYARMADADMDMVRPMAAPPAAGGEDAARSEPDEIDRLFTAG